MIGKMDQRVTLQRVTLTADGIGGTVKTWGSLGSVWAGVAAMPGKEGMVDGRMTANLPVTFTMYNRPDLTEIDRLIWLGDAYNIRNIRRLGKRQLHLVLDAERGAAQ